MPLSFSYFNFFLIVLDAAGFMKIDDAATNEYVVLLPLHEILSECWHVSVSGIMVIVYMASSLQAMMVGGRVMFL